MSLKTSISALYELRTYSLRLERVTAFLRDTEHLLHLRTRQSPLLGYWRSELGGLNQVVHLWPYDSLAHRASVRGTLAADADWVQKYVVPILNPAVVGQDNILLRPVADTTVNVPGGRGVTELLQLNLRGAESGWLPPLQHLAAAISGDSSCGSLIGCFCSAVGPSNTAVMLVHHPSQDALLQAEETRRNDAAYGDLLEHVQSAHSKLLLPLQISPIQ